MIRVLSWWTERDVELLPWFVAWYQDESADLVFSGPLFLSGKVPVPSTFDMSPSPKRFYEEAWKRRGVEKTWTLLVRPWEWLKNGQTTIEQSLRQYESAGVALPQLVGYRADWTARGRWIDPPEFMGVCDDPHEIVAHGWPSEEVSRPVLFNGDLVRSIEWDPDRGIIQAEGSAGLHVQAVQPALRLVDVSWAFRPEYRPARLPAERAVSLT